MMDVEHESEDFIQFNTRDEDFSRSFDGEEQRFSTKRTRSSTAGYNQDGSAEQGRKVTIEKIPREFCDEDQVATYFSQFGQIAYLKVYPQNQRAIIEFEEPSAAQAAFRSPDAIFGNRFVKIFLDRPSRSTNGFQGSNIQQSRQRFSPYNQNRGPSAYSSQQRFNPGFNSQQASYVPDYPPQPAFVPPAALEKQQKLSQLLELQKKKEAFLQKQIGEQKLLLEKLSSPDLPDVLRQELMSAVKSIQASIDELAVVPSPKDAATSETAPSTSQVPKQPQLSYSAGFRAQPKQANNYNLYKSNTGPPKAFKMDNMKKITISPIPDMFNENQSQFIKFFKVK